MPNMLTTPEQVAEYFANDRLECFICHRAYRRLDRHVQMAHGIIARDYKIKFGLPLNIGLVGADTRKQLINNAVTQRDKLEKLKNASADGRSVGMINKSANGYVVTESMREIKRRARAVRIAKSGRE